MSRAVIAVHGGAGSFEGLKWREEAPFRTHLVEACRAAAPYEDDALAMAAAAVAHMEASGAFNAGTGSVLNSEGRQFLDGALARGWDSNFGAVANVQATYSAVRLAQAVLEKSDHAFLVGEGADALARAEGLPPLPAPNDALKRVHEELKNGKKEKEKLGTFSFGGETDTVGAVALDAKGRLAAAGSTGGTWLKTPGRVGDTPVWGCGFYADRHRAVCATGVGELLMRGMASIRVANLCEAGLNPQDATEKIAQELADAFDADSAGFIAIDAQGRLGFGMNTRGMGRAHWRLGDEAGPVQAIWPDEDFAALPQIDL